MSPISIIFLFVILQFALSKPIFADSTASSIGQAAEITKTKQRSLLETLPPGLIAKMMKKIMAKLPPPNFTFSITPSKSKHSLSEHERKAPIL